MRRRGRVGDEEMTKRMVRRKGTRRGGKSRRG